MVQRLAKDPKKLKMYDDVITTQEKQEFIEKVENPDVTSGTCHYIPHHAVHKESSTTPIRIVYDCSCRKSSTHPSLNDCLTSGPPILKDLIAILLRFRQHKYGLVADIEKAFLHVSLDEEDRDITRFLWLSDPNDPTSKFDAYRFKSVLFGATSSPFILNATLDKHLSQYDEPVAEDIKGNIYVDDLVTGVQEEDEAVKYYNRARALMTPVGFNLRSWASNSTSVQTLAAKENLLDGHTETKVLGIQWETATDKLQYPRRVNVSNTNPVTKREMLRESSKLYDPLGLLHPVTVSAKIMMQEVWQRELEWDELLPPDIQDRWQKLVKELEAVTSMQIQRRYFPLTSEWPKDAELHIFVDASTKAYGAVAYVKSSEADQASFVMAKSRVAPLKKLTLPQLELTAALIGARLGSYLRGKLHVTKTILWTDSQIVIHWLRSLKQLKPYVANRVTEIKTLTRVWRYCPTSDNPADLLTRGISANQLKTAEIWSHGPA